MARDLDEKELKTLFKGFNQDVRTQLLKELKTAPKEITEAFRKKNWEGEENDLLKKLKAFHDVLEKI